MSSALCIMDVQVGIVERYATDGLLVGRLQRAVTAAREAHVQVIFVVVGFRAGHPEVSPNNLGFAAVARAGSYVEGDPAAPVEPSLAPRAGDIVVTKKRISAFAGSDFDMVLRSQGIDTLVLSGISTSGVILSTLRHAADLDYRLVVLSDGCTDGDPEIHRMLVEKLFPRQAAVLTVDEWIGSLDI